MRDTLYYTVSHYVRHTATCETHTDTMPDTPATYETHTDTMGDTPATCETHTDAMRDTSYPHWTQQTHTLETGSQSETDPVSPNTATYSKF